MPTWLITACSSGFGEAIAKAALEHGDHVVATARDARKLTKLKELGALTLALDITAPDDVIQKVAAEAVDIYGSIDYLVNNAGYVLVGGVEEASDIEAKAQFNTNVFGQMTVARAVLPYMRKQKSGVIANIGSIAGMVGGAGYGWYCASKYALAGLSESLREDVKHLGIQVVVIEPGYFRTNFLSDGHQTSTKNTIEDLRPAIDPVRDGLSRYAGNQSGDPVKGAKVIIEALTGTGKCKGRTLPSRLPLGSDATPFFQSVLEREKKKLEEWADVTTATDH